MILTEPKNAIIKQYKHSFSFDNTELYFDDEAIDAIAQKAIDQNTGARGLRAIIEKLVLEPMYQSPSLKGKKEVIINKDVVEKMSEVKVKVTSKTA